MYGKQARIKKYIRKTQTHRQMRFNFNRAPYRNLPSGPAYRPLVRGREVKCADIPETTDLISTTATFTLLNGVQEGSSFWNRIGRSIQMKSVHIKAQYVPTGNAAGVSEYLRVLIVYDAQPNGSTPAITDILQSLDQTGTATTTTFSFKSINNMDRFTIMRDWKTNIPNNDQAANSRESSVIDYVNHQIDEYVRLKNLATQFKSSSNPVTSADVATGTLWLVTFGNVPAATAGYQLNISARLRYRDT